jgi:hypothetical protein
MDRSLGWRPVVAAFAFVLAVHVCLYFWWVRADMLLSDDYSFFDPEEDFAEMVELFFRPLYRQAALALRDAALADPGAVFLLKAGHLLLTGIFVGFIAAFFAATARSAAAGVAMGILAATSLGQQINNVWLNIAPQVPTYILAVLSVWGMAAAAARSRAAGIAAMAAASAALAGSMFLYQMAPFYVVGLIGAYAVLTRDDDATLRRTVMLSAFSALFAVAFYAAALGYAVAEGMTAGRAASAVSLPSLAGRLAAIRPGYGFAWGGPRLAAGTAMWVCAAVILPGLLLALWNGADRRSVVRRWAIGIAATAVALLLPAMLNDFQGAARLYVPGAIGVAGLLVAAAVAIWRCLGAGWAAAPLKLAGAAALALAAVTASAQTVLAVGLPQYAEIRYIRTVLGGRGPDDLKGVYVILPAAGTPFWKQPGNAGREDLYALSMSTYHYWTARGIVRYALRYADPGHRVPVAEAQAGGRPPEGWTVVDMRPYDRALGRMP